MIQKLRNVHWLKYAVVSSLILTLSACGSKAPIGVASPSASPTTIGTTTTITPEPTPMPFTAPLTGLKGESEFEARPIAVMINNFAAARPQSGLTNADVIWEVLAEGGITRLIGIFHSTTELTDTIGPIRSIRPYLIEIGETYGGILAHAGASTDGYAILQFQGKPYLDEISNAGSYFWRSSERKAPHNLYSSLEKLREGADKKGYKKDVTIPSYQFSEKGASNFTSSAAAATEIDIKFTLKNYKVSYSYDAATALYSRSINDEPHIDLNNEKQLTASNLVVIGTKHKTLDSEGRLSVDLSTGGIALLFQQGKVIEAEWVRNSTDNMIRIVKDGAELQFVPGKTIFHIVPNTSSFDDHVTWVQN